MQEYLRALSLRLYDLYGSYVGQLRITILEHDMTGAETYNWVICAWNLVGRRRCQLQRTTKYGMLLTQGGRNWSVEVRRAIGMPSCRVRRETGGLGRRT